MFERLASRPVLVAFALSASLVGCQSDRTEAPPASAPVKARVTEKAPAAEKAPVAQKAPVAEKAPVVAKAPVAAAAEKTVSALKLAPMFSDHMVVQRGVESPIWGVAAPGAKVEIFIEDGKPVGSTTADAKGAFRMKLPVLSEGAPHRIVITAGNDTEELTDVLAGEVWICSGQSNMQWSVFDSNDRDQEIQSANHPQIRFLTVPRKTSDTPQETFEAQWQVCSPETVGGFSAVGYFFGRELHQELNVPIGLINSSWGGTIAETWTPAKEIAALGDLPGVAKLSTTLKESQDPVGRERLAQALRNYDARADRLLVEPGEVAADWAKPDFDDSGWTSIEQPGDWRTLEPANGLGWMRRAVDVPAELAGKDLTLRLARVDDFDVTFFNGERVGDVLPSSGGGFITSRNYTVPGKLVKAGRNVIAVRILDTGGAGGLGGPGQEMKLEPKPASDGASGGSSTPLAGSSIPLAGEWKFKLERGIDPAREGRPLNPADPGNPNMPSRLYNAMIYPLHDFGIRGAIWYQGESNAARHAEYERVLSTMIGAWRQQFRGAADAASFPFYQVGLANFQAPTEDPNQPSDWAYLREAQRQVDRNVKNVGMTVTIDIGEARDIHPRNKQDVGKRLALLALEETYGKDLVSRGPTLKEATFDGGRVVVSFDHVGSGLVAKGETLKSFAIAGEDGKFAWADAKIEGNTVVLTSADVPAPTQVRYAFADNPVASLFNQEGLPAEPFQAKKGATR